MICVICGNDSARAFGVQDDSIVKYYDVLVEDVGSIQIQYAIHSTIVNILPDNKDACERCLFESLIKGLAKDLRLDSISAINPASEGVNENGS